MKRSKLRAIICWRCGWGIGFFRYLKKHLCPYDDFLNKLKEFDGGEPWRNGKERGKEQSRLVQERSSSLDRLCEVDHKELTDSVVATRLGWYFEYKKHRSEEIFERTKGRYRGGFGSDLGYKDARTICSAFRNVAGDP